MVLPASAADEGQAGRAAWLERIRGILELGREGVLILVPDAKLAQLRPLMRALWAIDAGARIVVEAEELAECADNELVLLVLRAQDAGWLNRNRPLFAQRRLRMVLWGEEELVGEMRGRAPDFFDWVSHVVECPFGVPEFTRRGLELGTTWHPGIVWRGGLELREVLGHLGARYVDGPGEVEYPEWVEFLTACEADFLHVGELSSNHSLRRIRWAVAETRFAGTILLDAPDMDTPGWFPVDAQQQPLGELDPAEFELGVLLELEREALSLVVEFGTERAAVRSSTRDELDQRVTEVASGFPAWPEIRQAAVTMRRSGPILRRLFASGEFEELALQLVRDARLLDRYEFALLPGIPLDKIRANASSILSKSVAADEIAALHIELALLDWGPRKVAASEHLYKVMALDPPAGEHLATLVGRAPQSDERLALVRALAYIGDRAEFVLPEELNAYVLDRGETLGWSSSTVLRILPVAFARTPDWQGLAAGIWKAAQRQLGPRSLDLAGLSCLLAALVGARHEVTAARPWLERACEVGGFECDILAALDLLEGRAEQGLARLLELRDHGVPSLRERQLLVLALRMNGQSELAAEFIDSWADEEASAAKFEYGPPREWLTRMLESHFETQLTAVEHEE